MVPRLRWDADRLMRVSGTPIALSTAHFDSIETAVDPHRGPVGHRDDGAEDDDPTEPLIKRMPILHRDLQDPAVGYTQGCDNCQ